MDDQRQMELSGLRDRIAGGQYEIDARAVADAIVRRAQGIVPMARELEPVPVATGEAQSACSYPDSPPSEPANVTAGDPAATTPTHVRPAPLSHRRLSASARARALRGIQAQSS